MISMNNINSKKKKLEYTNSEKIKNEIFRWNTKNKIIFCNSFFVNIIIYFRLNEYLK